MIYASFQRYPTSYQTVDAIIWRRERDDSDKLTGGVEILLGRKRADAQGAWRYIGGFVQPEDDSLETAALREAKEETGCELDRPRYLFSARVEDWRYRDEVDGICTAVFACAYLFGAPTAEDDIDDLKWFVFSPALGGKLVPEHKRLWARVEETLMGAVDGG
jgi:bifunctional NMN adenylyltransferase/nudix hydrolase